MADLSTDVPAQDVTAGLKEGRTVTHFCTWLMRRSALESAGLMDERFFLYYEDAEHSHRIRKAGWDLIHVPEASVVHLEGGSTGIVDMREKRSRL